MYMQVYLLVCIHVYKIAQLYPEMFFRKFVNTIAIHLCVFELSEEHFWVQLYNFVNMHAT